MSLSSPRRLFVVAVIVAVAVGAAAYRFWRTVPDTVQKATAVRSERQGRAPGPRPASPGPPAALVEGRLVPSAGVQTASVQRERLGRSVRTLGTVLPEEGRVRRVHATLAGWIEKLYVDATDRFVREGEPLVTVYSPELAAAREEFLRVREMAARFERSPSSDVRQLGRELLESARRRLAVAEPAAVVPEASPSATTQAPVTLVAPTSGYVVGTNLFVGQKVTPGTELFEVIDLTAVWVDAELYGYDPAAVRVGQSVSLRLPGDGRSELQGKLIRELPSLTPEGRILKLRFEFPNPNLALKPQTYGEVWLAVEGREVLAVPNSALLDAGVQQIAFVEKAPGTFEPRQVRTGARDARKSQILSGLAPGERVVVDAKSWASPRRDTSK